MYIRKPMINVGHTYLTPLVRIGRYSLGRWSAVARRQREGMTKLWKKIKKEEERKAEPSQEVGFSCK
jgi:hypothetical protein